MKIKGFFIVFSVMILTLHMVGCGSNLSVNNNGDNTAPEPGCIRDAGVVYSNPTHAHTTIPLSLAQLIQAEPRDYTLLDGDHAHTFSLTIEDFADLQNGGSLSLTSDRDDHVILVNCSVNP